MKIVYGKEAERNMEAMAVDGATVKRLRVKLDDASYNNMISIMNDSNILYMEWQPQEHTLYLNEAAMTFFNMDEGSRFAEMENVFGKSAYMDMLKTFSKVETGKVQNDSKIWQALSNKKTYVIRMHFMKVLENADAKKVRVLATGQVQEGILCKEDHSSRPEGATVCEPLSMLEQIISAIPMPLFFTDGEGVVQYGNQSLEKLLPMSLSDMLGQSIEACYERLQAHVNVEIFKKTVGADKKASYHIKAFEKDSARDVLMDEIEVIRGKSGISGSLFILTDITNRIQDIEYVHRLLKANNFLLQIGDMVKQGIDIDDLYRTILEGVLEIIPNANKGCVLLLDFNNNIYIKENVGYDEDYAKQFRIPFYSSFASMVLGGNYRKSVFINNIQEKYSDLFPDVNSTKRGFVLNSNITSPINVDGKLYGLISIDSGDPNGFDDTDLNLIDFLRGKIESSVNRFKELSSVIESSTKDELTGAFNRRFYKKIIDSLISESTLNKETFSMVVFDMDDLKVLNDGYGHLAGDELLKKFTAVMMANMREDDILARIGGDEFVGLFKNIDKVRLEKKIKDIIRIMDSEGLQFEGHNIQIKFSFGISQFPVDGEVEKALLAVADKNMYCCKNEKKK